MQLSTIWSAQTTWGKMPIDWGASLHTHWLLSWGLDPIMWISSMATEDQIQWQACNQILLIFWWNSGPFTEKLNLLVKEWTFSIKKWIILLQKWTFFTKKSKPFLQGGVFQNLQSPFLPPPPHPLPDKGLAKINTNIWDDLPRVQMINGNSSDNISIC